MAAESLADTFWRGAALLYSDYMDLYDQSASLLGHALALRPPNDVAFADALRRTLPAFWQAAPQSQPLAPGASPYGTFPGLQPLLLKGLGRRTTRATCLRLMQRAALNGPQPNAFLESESTRLLTCTAALLPWLCTRPEPEDAERRETIHELSADGGADDACAEDKVARTLADAFGAAASKQGRKELLSLAVVLNNYANRQYDEVPDQFWGSMRAAFAQAMAPQPAWTMYIFVCTLVCGVSVGPACSRELLSLVRHLIKGLARGDAQQPVAEPGCGAPPAPQLWQSLLELARDVPDCTEQLAATIKVLLAASSEGYLLPTALVQFQMSVLEAEAESPEKVAVAGRRTQDADELEPQTRRGRFHQQRPSPAFTPLPTPWTARQPALDDASAAAAARLGRTRNPTREGECRQPLRARRRHEQSRESEGVGAGRHG